MYKWRYIENISFKMFSILLKKNWFISIIKDNNINILLIIIVQLKNKGLIINQLLIERSNSNWEALQKNY